MVFKADGRMSDPHAILFEKIKKIFPRYSVLYEQFSICHRYRFDIFVKELGIAIEYDGDQHYVFKAHFHKNINGFIEALNRDKGKAEFCLENGIKLVRFKKNEHEEKIEKIKTKINKIPYPGKDFCLDTIDWKMSQK